MTNLERNATAILGLGSVLWGGGLFVAYALRDAPPPVAAPADARPALPTAAAGGGTQVLPATVTIAGPPVATTVGATGLPTPEEKRAHLEAGPADDDSPSAGNPHGRWEDRTGVVLPPPSGLAATPVTVHLKGVPVRKALAEVGKAAGLRMVAFPPYVWRQTPFPAAVTLDADARPAMEVVNELCAKTGLAGGARTTVNWDGGPATTDPADPTLGFQPQDADGGLGPWVVTGPFSFEVQRVSHVAAVPPGPAAAADGGGGSLTVLLTMQHEPGVVVLGQQSEVAVTAATDEAGHSLLVDGTVATPPAAGPRRGSDGGLAILGRLLGLGVQQTSTRTSAGPQWGPAQGTMSVSLACPPDVGRRIARLRLTPRFLIADQSERVEVPVGAGHAGDTERAAAGLAVTVGPVNGTQQCSCVITYKRGRQTDAEWDQLRAALGNVVPVLADARGRALPAPQNSYVRAATDRSISVMGQWFQQQYGGNETVLRPAKLVVNVPRALRAVDVPIELTDLPLP